MRAVLPRYAEIRSDFETRIRSGQWAPGRRIASEHDLMEQYGCSRMTVHKALTALAAAGLITRKRRSGSFVAAPRTEETVLAIHDIEAEITGSGRAYAYELLERIERGAGAQDAERLAVQEGEAVLALVARHWADGRPHVVEDRLINLAAVPEARAADFSGLASGSWLLKQVPWTDAEHTIGAVSAGARLASHLEIAKGAACLVVQRRTWQSGAPVTQVCLTYPGERHRLVGRFSPEAALRVARPAVP
jgi:GntR family transcriptional regulator, histidine utilization repressor